MYERQNTEAILVHFSLKMYIWFIILVIITVMAFQFEESFSLNRSILFVITYLYLIGFFYVNANYLIAKFIFKKKYFLYMVGIFLFLILYIYFHKYTIVLFTHFGYIPHPIFPIEGSSTLHDIEKVTALKRFMLPITQFILFWVLSFCYRLTIEWISAKKKNKEIETEKTVIELAYLKAQINPHFLFNTLNTIYSLALNGSERTIDAILLYSQTVRYVLDKTDTNFVPLEEEIEYISNYIQLQSLRFPDSLNIKFEVKGNIEGYKIAPLIFISYIENAFQYGISNHFLSFITICIEVSSEGVSFVAKNSIHKKIEYQRTGKNIGIKNTQRKLNLIYPDKYKLFIDETENIFTVNLFIYDTGKEQ